MYAPVSLGAAGNPVVFGSKGHMIIQCGPILIVGFVMSNGSDVLHHWVPPASMYVMPGTLFVGFGFRALKSAAHCIEGASMHTAGSPM